MEEEKKPINLKLSTAIYLFIILVLAVGIAFLAVQNSRLENMILNSNQTAQSKTEETQVAQNETATTTPIENNGIEGKYKEITSALGEEERLFVTDVEKINDKYTLKGVIYKPYTLSKSEYDEIISKGEMEYTDDYAPEGTIKYIVKMDGHNGYALYHPKDADVISYVLNLKNGVYYLMNPTESNSTEWKVTDEYRMITLDGNIKCNVFAEHDEETTVSENFKDFTPKTVNPIDHHPWLYSFKFENGKCTSINFYAIRYY